MCVVRVRAVGLVKDFLCLLTSAYCLIPAKKLKCLSLYYIDPEQWPQLSKLSTSCPGDHIGSSLHHPNPGHTAQHLILSHQAGKKSILTLKGSWFLKKTISFVIVKLRKTGWGVWTQIYTCFFLKACKDSPGLNGVGDSKNCTSPGNRTSLGTVGWPRTRYQLPLGLAINTTWN